MTLVLLLLLSLAHGGPLDDGDAAFARGDHPAALVAWSEGLVQARADEDQDAQRELLLRMASAQRELGAVDLASRVVEEAQALAESEGAKADVALARGMLALHVGDLDAAVPAFRGAYRAYRGAEAPRGAANAAINLGVARLHLGANDEARQAFEAALSLFKALGDSGGQADAIVDLALLDRRAGDLREARTRLDVALSTYQKIGDDEGRIDAWADLAAVEAALARPEAARRHLQAALSLATERRSLAQQARLNEQLATLDHHEGRTEEAAKVMEQVAAAYTELGRERDALISTLDRIVMLGGQGVTRTHVAEAERLGDPALAGRARVLRAYTVLDEDPASARNHAEKALKIARRAGLDEVRWQARFVLGESARRSGDLDDAALHLQVAVQVLDERRSLLERDDAQAFTQAHEPVYRALIDVQISRGETLEAMATTDRLSLADLPVQAPRAELSDLAGRETWLRQRLGDELVDRGETARAVALRTELAELRVQFAATVDRLRNEVDDLDQRVRIHPEDLEAMQAELAEGVVVLQPVVLPDRLVLLVFSRDTLKAVPVAVSPAELEGTLARLTRALRAGLRDRAVLDPLADKLGGWLWAPVADVMAEAEVVVVSTSGSLRQLPFALIRHEGRYLVQHSALATVTHVGSLQAATTPLRVEGRGLLLVGNPDGTLPGAEAEVRSLGERFEGSALLVGPDATRGALLGRLRERTIVHLATHGRIDPLEPSHSYLVLAPDDTGEARLGYREIPGLAPFLSGARMVVLSACESGRPVDAKQAGVVSIQGLAAQFRRAGVETLVASLWKVDDAGTRALMEGFYDQLGEGHDAATALAEAQRGLLEEPEHGSPWVWAAFVVAGDWR